MDIDNARFFSMANGFRKELLFTVGRTIRRRMVGGCVGEMMTIALMIMMVIKRKRRGAI